MATIVKKRECQCKDRARCGHRPWAVRYVADGSQRETSFRTKGEASAFALQAEQSKRDGAFVDPRAGKILFTDYARNWVATQPLASGTKAAYLSAITAQIEPAVGRRTLAQVANDRELVQGIIAGMTQGSSRKATVLSVLTGACNEAVTAGKISKHRLAGIPVPKDALKPATIVPVTKTQMEIIAGNLRPDEALSAWLMSGTGLRVSEALAVKIDGFREGTLRVSEQVARSGGTAPLKRRRAGEYRDVPVAGWLKAKVDEHVATFDTDDGYLFGHNGVRIAYGHYHDRFAMACVQAGLVGFTEHGLRHLFASTMLDAGVPITDLAKWLGHKDINITYAVYGHLLPNSWERGRKALESMWA
jgi:integrase